MCFKYFVQALATYRDGSEAVVPSAIRRGETSYQWNQNTIKATDKWLQSTENGNVFFVCFIFFQLQYMARA